MAFFNGDFRDNGFSSEMPKSVDKSILEWSQLNPGDLNRLTSIPDSQYLQYFTLVSQNKNIDPALAQLMKPLSGLVNFLKGKGFDDKELNSLTISSLDAINNQKAMRISMSPSNPLALMLDNKIFEKYQVFLKIYENGFVGFGVTPQEELLLIKQEEIPPYLRAHYRMGSEKFSGITLRNQPFKIVNNLLNINSQFTSSTNTFDSKKNEDSVREAFINDKRIELSKKTNSLIKSLLSDIETRDIKVEAEKVTSAKERVEYLFLSRLSNLSNDEILKTIFHEYEINKSLFEALGGQYYTMPSRLLNASNDTQVQIGVYNGRFVNMIYSDSSIKKMFGRAYSVAFFDIRDKLPGINLTREGFIDVVDYCFNNNIFDINQNPDVFWIFSTTTGKNKNNLSSQGGRDYYSVLRVKQNASPDEIRKAFRDLAKQYHPDVNREKGAEARFKEINNAYETLSDPTKRAAYDRMRGI